MPKRTDLETILIIGSGPIVIGQACEFDYSGTQACRVLRDEGYRVVLVNSNPATIMTDPEFADATYVEPLDLESLTRVIERERPDALLPTLGGQTALNLAIELHDAGVLAAFEVELIGASVDAIHTAENRDQFKVAMQEIGLSVPVSGLAYALDEAMDVAARVGYPLIVRPSFILGGGGTGFAADPDELRRVAAHGLATSPVSEILIEQSIAGWKEYELEVMRDHADNVVVVCSIENFDAMGVHTGDSITVAPAQTLTDVEYQRLRDAAFACIRRIGVDTGGSNIQFAVNPANGDTVVIEMNPRVSRSSALASKATGFPIAKIAARLAVGYRLDEIMNDITGETPASFEPTIDYVVTKIPRWAFEKLPGASPVLGTMMQSVGEVMAIGRTFPESFQKALRSLETGRYGLNCDPTEREYDAYSDDDLVRMVTRATPERPFLLDAALRRGVSVERLHSTTGIDPWFLDHLASLGELRRELASRTPHDLSAREWKRVKRAGFSDAQLAYLWNVPETEVFAARSTAGVQVTYKTVDTCAAEFAASTPYHYSTYEDEDEVAPLTRDAVVILGSGPNRIGQGVEFDYCCVHAAFALSDAGYETVMVNCNPETVSTDYDTSDRLFFEPLHAEDVLAICHRLQERGREGGGALAGAVVALGGQTPLKLARTLEAAGIPVLGTSPDSIDLAEDRERFHDLCERLGIAEPPGGTAFTAAEARAVADAVGYPVLVRPSYVLGGRAMQIVYDVDGLDAAMAELAAEGTLGREGGLSAERPVLVDRFLEDAIEVDVDALRDAVGEVLIGGVMEHIEEAGVHSGDSACAIPPQTLPADIVAQLEAHTAALADALDVRGLLNVQFAVKSDGTHQQVSVIEANPRASRTVPFVSKATGVPLAKAAARVMLGATIAELREEGLLHPPAEGGHIAVKEAVLPFSRFPDVDTVLGPEMRSTGEVMGIDRSFGMAFLKSQIGAGNRLPREGTVFLSLADRDKATGLIVARRFAELGLTLVATAGTAAALEGDGLEVAAVIGKLSPLDDAGMLDAVELLESGKVDLVVNTPRGRGPRADGAHIRRTATARGIPCVTTVAAALAVSAGILEATGREATVRSLQEYHRDHQQRLGIEVTRPRQAKLDAPVDLAVTLGGLELVAPVVTASGTFGHGAEVAGLGEPYRLGAVTAKSLCPDPWPGKPTPRLHTTAAGMLNAVGLQGPGVAAWIERDLPALRASGARVIASVWGRTVDEFALAARLLLPARDDLVAIEVNVSCPNLHDRSEMFAHAPGTTAAAVAAVVGVESELPIFAKLSPNVTDLVDIARAAVGAGADGLTLVNTVMGLLVDAETRRPVLGGGGGGLSGPAIKPIALRAVHDVARALPDVPIIGTGGVQSGVDAVEMMLAGASAVAVGTASFLDPRAPYRVLDELREWCAGHGVTRVAAN